MNNGVRNHHRACTVSNGIGGRTGRRACWPHGSPAPSDLYRWQHLTPFAGSLRQGGGDWASDPDRSRPVSKCRYGMCSCSLVGAGMAAGETNYTPGIQRADEVVPVGPAQ
jgi:hypothetical protein